MRSVSTHPGERWPSIVVIVLASNCVIIILNGFASYLAFAGAHSTRRDSSSDAWCNGRHANADGPRPAGAGAAAAAASDAGTATSADGSSAGRGHGSAGRASAGIRPDAAKLAANVKRVVAHLKCGSNSTLEARPRDMANRASCFRTNQTNSLYS